MEELVVLRGFCVKSNLHVAKLESHVRRLFKLELDVDTTA